MLRRIDLPQGPRLNWRPRRIDDAATTSRRREVSPEPRNLLDDLMSMNVADIDRERLVHAYLDSLLRAVEGRSREPGGKPLKPLVEGQSIQGCVPMPHGEPSGSQRKLT